MCTIDRHFSGENHHFPWENHHFSRGKSPFTGPGQWQNVASHASPASLGIPDHSQGGKDLLKALVEVPHGLMIGSMDVSIVLYYIYNVVPPR